MDSIVRVTDIGISRQAPSDQPEFAAFLVHEGIDSIGVTPDSLARSLERVAAAEVAAAATVDDTETPEGTTS